MAETEATWEELRTYIETQCEPLSQEEEVEVDNDVLALTIASLPEKAGFTYEELEAEIEALRSLKDTPMPNWVWEAQFFEGRPNQAIQKNQELNERIFEFTNLFSELLIKVIQERGLVYGTFLVAPFVVVRGGVGKRLYRPKAEAGKPSDQPSPKTPGMMLLTSKIAGHMNGFITGRAELSSIEQLPVYGKGQAGLVSARSRLNLPRGTERPNATDLLEKMHRTLLRHKEEAASLLKTHLYLVDRAYGRGGDSPTFVVEMDELLEAKGYKRRADGAFHPSTYREESGRIATLAGCWLELRRVNGKGKRGKEEAYIDETPYWEVRARRRLDEGEALGLETVLLQDPNAPIIKAVVMQPGLWWGVSDRESMRFYLPREVLALPTDGKGNETQRMAVQLAATLALWVRSSQKHHAGEERPYSVGALLEASGIRTQFDFESMNRRDVGRLREYLAGTEAYPGGALHHLTTLGAFDIHIRDEDDFWASGRGWQKRFWEAQLVVRVPNLGIKKPETLKKSKKLPKQAAA